MAVAFTLYNGFLIVEYSEFDVKAYRNRAYYADDTASYEAINQHAISQMIDEANDQGDFTMVEYSALMQELGRSERGLSSESAQLAQEKRYQVSPNGALLRDVLAAMETVALAEGYGPLEGTATVSQIVHEQSIGVFKGYTRRDVEDTLRLALGAGFVHEV